MKNLLIASIMLFSFSFSAQVEKNPKKDKGTSTQVSTKNPSSFSKAAPSSSTQTNIISEKKVSLDKGVYRGASHNGFKFEKLNSDKNHKKMYRGQVQ